MRIIFKQGFIGKAFAFIVFFSGLLNAAEQQPNVSDKKDAVTTEVQQARLGLTIKGNQELPNILYIVPWKSGSKNDVSPIKGRIVEEVFGPVEANVFKRKVKLYRALTKKNNKSGE